MPLTVRRASPADEAVAHAIVDEYYAALAIVARDTSAAFRTYLEGPGGLWLAERDGEAVGCVAFRPLSSVEPGAGEVKRLYVRPQERRRGTAGALMDALERWAAAAGCSALLLDTKDDLQAAIRFYRARGYEPIPRYNDNPQATIFLRRPCS